MLSDVNCWHSCLCSTDLPITVHLRSEVGEHSMWACSPSRHLVHGTQGSMLDVMAEKLPSTQTWHTVSWAEVPEIEEVYECYCVM